MEKFLEKIHMEMIHIHQGVKMDRIIDSITRNLFQLIVSVFILWIVVQMALSGYNYIKNSLSGVHLKEKTFNEYRTDLYNTLNKVDINNSDILKITNFYDRKSDYKFQEIGYSVILEDFYVLTFNDTNKSSLLKNNLKKLNSLISTIKEEEPYTNLPDKERIVLKNFNFSIKSNDIARIEENFLDLKQVIEQRYSEYKRIENEAEENRIITYVSIFLALLSLVMPPVNFEKVKSLFYREEDDINKKNIE